MDASGRVDGDDLPDDAVANPGVEAAEVPHRARVVGQDSEPVADGGLGWQVSCPFSHSLGTIRLNRGVRPFASAASKSRMSFGPVVPAGTTCASHRAEVDVADHPCSHAVYWPEVMAM